jgi:hypothetical protein
MASLAVVVSDAIRPIRVRHRNLNQIRKTKRLRYKVFVSIFICFVLISTHGASPASESWHSLPSLRQTAIMPAIPKRGNQAGED